MKQLCLSVVKKGVELSEDAEQGRPDLQQPSEVDDVDLLSKWRSLLQAKSMTVLMLLKSDASLLW